ncbi:DUF4275 family protein [Tahibacter sp.]|uniref:DUF4275 family protein n=1 Tax=Tahibacter sp. TaxID=2056211 RepID=UPI0028C46420|nr:DUF4275 family protein [Tahibacter sp.]
MKSSHQTDAGAESDILRTYTKSEAAALAAQWLDVFGKNRRGVNTKDFLWHVFSGARYPSLSGVAALAEYDKQVVHEYTVVSNERDVAFVISERPADKLMWDYLVFPANFAWTMAFTHEAGWLGPYFARHPDYARLTAANLARVEKEREAAEPVRRADGNRGLSMH